MISDSPAEGVIKFELDFASGALIPDWAFRELSAGRALLKRAGLVGEDAGGIGYGNLSVRGPEDTFYISGTQTGGLENLPRDGYTSVTSCDVKLSKVVCRGPIKASSESLTHFAFYQADPRIRSVAHAHHRGLWQELCETGLATPPSIPYGTAELAHELMQHLSSRLDEEASGVVAIGGHEEGVFAFGPSAITIAQSLIAVTTQ